jgi:acyl-CoA thioesterase I
MKNLFLSILAMIFLSSCAQNKVIKVACVGDSITEGAGILWQSKSAYPVQLNNILGPGYNVLNCGRSGATLLKSGDLSYWTCNEFSNVFAFQPDKIVIKLGTNDSKPQNWNSDKFGKDLNALIDTFRTIRSNPEILVCLPVPAYAVKWGIRDSVITSGVLPIIEKAAAEKKLTVIDLYKPLSGHVELFPDSIHPNESGARMMAEVVAGSIKR